MSDVTVESLLEQCDLTESDLNSWIERVHFLEISRCLKEWRLLALKLPELNEGVVADIETDNHREQDRRLKFLEQLKQKLAINATYGLLVRKLVEIGKRDDAHSLCRHLKDITPASARIEVDSGTGIHQVPTTNTATASSSTIRQSPRRAAKVEEPIEKSGNSSEIVTPKARISDLDYKPFLECVRYVIATFNDNEFDAATTVVTSPDIEGDSKGITNYEEGSGIYLGMVGKHPVGLLTCSQGRDCEKTMKKGICLFPNAKYLVAAGVCYGFSSRECKLGDVLISDMIIDLGNYRIGDNIESRGDHVTTKEQVKNIFCHNPKHVKPFEVAKGRNAQYFVGKIVSAPNLVDDNDMKEKFKDAVKYNKVYGGEMEGGEMLRLQKDGIVMPNGEKKFVEVIVIKSVTDFADGKKTKEWQFIGAQAALNYVKDKMAMQPAIPMPASARVVEDGGTGIPQTQTTNIIKTQASARIVKDNGTAIQEVSTANITASRKGSSIDLNCKNVYKMLYPARENWYKIGMELDVDINTLAAFRKDYDSVDEKLGAVINHWLNNSTNKSWTKLAEVMGSVVVNRQGIKMKIMEMIK